MDESFLDARTLRRAVEALNSNSRFASDDMLRQQAMAMRGNMPSFRDDSETKRLKLTLDGYEVIIQTQVPRGLPIDRVANQFARYTHDLLQRFPSGWSRVGESSGEDNREVENESEPENENSNDRFGAAFE